VGKPVTGSVRAPGAVLFDIDGTLVDSNYLHVDAWLRALQAVGHPVGSSLYQVGLVIK
jgi:beta-phosphoglucomutase-like phosphatase (HAD superfamily)